MKVSTNGEVLQTLHFADELKAPRVESIVSYKYIAIVRRERLVS